MAKRATKTKSQRQAELAERMTKHPTYKEAVQGSYLGSGVDVFTAPEESVRDAPDFDSREESAALDPVLDKNAAQQQIDEEQQALDAEMDAEIEGELKKELDEDDEYDAEANTKIDDAIQAEEPEEEKVIHSVVAPKYKNKYIENANAIGVKHKAAKRSNWDWLAQEIAAFTLDDKHSIRMDDFLHLLEANEVDHSRWTNRNKGWEGRLRMTGRVALQRKIIEAGHLKFPDGTQLEAPTSWLNKYTKEA